MSEQYIVSGANGFLGGKVVSLLAGQRKRVIGLCRNAGIQEADNVSFVSNDTFLADPGFFMNDPTVFIHLAFARANRGACEIAESLDFTKDILSGVATSGNLKKFIYISSQGIYGKSEAIRVVENKAEPESLYSMAKYAAEKMVEMMLRDKNYCILRLDNVIQSQNLIRVLSEAAIRKGRIVIKGGKQVFSYIDGDDAAGAIVLCACKEKSIRNVYNVGPNRMRTPILEVAETVKQIAAKYNSNIEIIYNPDDTALWSGMDSKSFCLEYNWKPRYDLFQMIERVYKDTLDICGVCGGGVIYNNFLSETPGIRRTA